METQAAKEEKGGKSSGSLDGGATLRRQMQTKHSNSFNENLKQRRQNVDSGYCTSDGGWLHETLPKYQPAHNLHIRTDLKLSKSGSCTPTISSPGSNGNSIYDQISQVEMQDQLDKKNKINSNYLNNNNR